jgi:tetratricopeptide (TPR) repeat protein
MRWNIYHSGNTIQAGQGLHLWLGELEQFVKEVPKNGQIATLLNMSYQLQGSIFRDEMNSSESHNAYKRAYFVADEFDNPELKSASLARRGVTFIQQTKPIDAIQYLEWALVFTKGYDLPCLEGYIYQALSEAYAMAQDSQQSWSNVLLAEKALQRKNEAPGISNVNSNTTSVTSQKGVNAVLLKDYGQALTLLDAGLAKYDPTLRRGRARLIAQKAEAFYGLGLIDESTKSAMEALTIAQPIGSQKTIDRVKCLHLLLQQSQYKNEKGVVHLGKMITPV